MKVIKYTLRTETAFGSGQPVFVRMGWNEVNEEIAKKEAYRGEYTIEDDGQQVEKTETIAERLESLESSGAELREALELILSEVTE